MTARSLAAVLVVVAAGVLIGSGLAALAQAPSNDPCADFGTLPEGSSSSGSLELSGAGWQSAGFNVALSISVLVGAPLAFVVDHLLRPRNTRSVGGSLRVALAIAALSSARSSRRSSSRGQPSRSVCSQAPSRACA
jgi:hypothetical protein